MDQNEAEKLSAEAKDNIAQIERVFQKIQQLIRIKLGLEKRKDAVLKEMINTGNIGLNVKNLKLILEKERRVLNITVNEDEIEKSNIFI